MSIGGRKFPCSNCPSVFGQKHSLTRHLKYECCQEPRFQCSECRYRCKRAANVYKHVRMMHRESEVCAIDLVTNRVFRPSELCWSTPFRLVDGKLEKYPCPNCKTSEFREKLAVLKRNRYGAGVFPRFLCPYCMYMSKKKCHVERHASSLHKKNPVYVVDLKHCVYKYEDSH